MMEFIVFVIFMINMRGDMVSFLMNYKESGYLH